MAIFKHQTELDMTIIDTFKELADLSSYRILKLLLFISLFANWKQNEAKDLLMKTHQLDINSLTELYQKKEIINEKERQKEAAEKREDMKMFYQKSYSLEKKVDSLLLVIKFRK